MHVPVAELQSFAVVSHEAVRSWAPSGEKAALRTGPSWPRSVRTQSPLSALHRRAVPPPEA
eukprot:1063305-Alexandrium_andersonii.AAC.1